MVLATGTELLSRIDRGGGVVKTMKEDEFDYSNLNGS